MLVYIFIPSACNTTVGKKFCKSLQDIFLWWLAIYSYYSPPLVSANDAAGRGGNKQSTHRWTQTRPVLKESLFIYTTACLENWKNIWHEICSPKMRDCNNDLCAQSHILCLQAVWFCQSQVGPWSLKSHNHSTPHTTRWRQRDSTSITRVCINRKKN